MKSTLWGMTCSRTHRCWGRWRSEAIPAVGPHETAGTHPPAGACRRHTEVEEAAAEGDGPQREPGPADGEPGEDVGQPVHAEQHPGAGHGHGDGHGAAGERRPGPAAPPSTEQEGDHGEGGGGRGGVARGERGRREPGELLEVRPGPVDDHLDQVDEGELPADGEDQQGGDRPVGRRRYSTTPTITARLTTPEGAAEIAEPAEHGRRTRGGVRRPPAGEGEVVVGDARLGPDHEEEDAGGGGEDDHGRHRQREGEAGEDLGVESRPPPGPQPARRPTSGRQDGGVGGEAGSGRIVVRPPPHDGPHERARRRRRRRGGRGSRPRPDWYPRMIPAMPEIARRAHDPGNKWDISERLPQLGDARIWKHRVRQPSLAMSAQIVPLRRSPDAGARPVGPGPAAGRAVVVAGWLAVVSALVLTGLLLTHVLLDGTLGRWDTSSTRWLSTHRGGVLDGVTGFASRSADTLGIIGAALVVVDRAGDPAALGADGRARHRPHARAERLPGRERPRGAGPAGRPPDGSHAVDRRASRPATRRRRWSSTGRSPSSSARRAGRSCGGRWPGWRPR